MEWRELFTDRTSYIYILCTLCICTFCYFHCGDDTEILRAI